MGHPSGLRLCENGYMSNEPSPDPSTELLPGDYYYDGPYLVFTAQYHLRRGYCCNSGCRHCPYRSSSEKLT